MDHDFITLARVLKTQGRHGEVAVELHSDVPNRFHEGMRLFALGKEEASPRREVKVESLWPHKGLLVLKLEGIESISDAETLIGCELQVPSAERSSLDPGWTFVSDLVGCTVFDGNREIGRLAEVRFGAGEAPLLVVKATAQEHEIPYTEAYLRTVDLKQKQIHMELPDGMLDVNGPMTAEEKQHPRS